MSRIGLSGRRRGALRALALVVLVVLASTGAITPASAYLPGSKHLVLQNNWSWRCLDADRTANGANGAKVQIWDCNSDWQQQWVVTYLPDGWMKIQNGWSGNCLDADLNTANSGSTKVQLWACNGSIQQQWTSGAGWSGTDVLKSRLNGNILTVNWWEPGGNGTDVTLVGEYAGNHQYKGAQEWFVSSVD